MAGRGDPNSRAAGPDSGLSWIKLALQQEIEHGAMSVVVWLQSYSCSRPRLNQALVLQAFPVHHSQSWQPTAVAAHSRGGRQPWVQEAGRWRRQLAAFGRPVARRGGLDRRTGSVGMLT